MKELTVGIVQQQFSRYNKTTSSIEFYDTETNMQRNKNFIVEAVGKGAELVLLSELHTCPYFCQTENITNFSLAQKIPGPSTDFFCELAKNLNVVLVTSIFEERAPGLYHNTAVVMDRDGSIAGKYRKMHIPDDPGYYEKYYFAPGDLGFAPIKTSVGNLGVLICWDQWFPEAARLMAINGADLLLYPTAIGFNLDEHNKERNKMIEAWQLIQRSHAIANGLPVLCANRVGFEPIAENPKRGIEFWGNSFIAGAQGEILTKIEDIFENILVTKIDMSKTKVVRQNWPFLRDRRIDMYKELTMLYQKL